jgi:muramoyltetrapeptide carboxypeptidase
MAAPWAPLAKFLLTRQPDLLSWPRCGNTPHCLRRTAIKFSSRLVGGYLTLICSTLDTPYQIEAQGNLLFIEDTMPVLMNFPIGHQPHNATLPHGASAELDAAKGTLRPLENSIRLE